MWDIFYFLLNCPQTHHAWLHTSFSTRFTTGFVPFSLSKPFLVSCCIMFFFYRLPIILKMFCLCISNSLQQNSRKVRFYRIFFNIKEFLKYRRGVRVLCDITEGRIPELCLLALTAWKGTLFKASPLTGWRRIWSLDSTRKVAKL